LFLIVVVVLVFNNFLIFRRPYLHLPDLRSIYVAASGHSLSGLGSEHTEVHSGIWHRIFVVVPDQGLLLLDAKAAYCDPQGEDREDVIEGEALL
jgi:hypothetical protein